MAAPKIIPYQVKLRSTTIERSISRPVIYTNDLRSAEFQFKVIDMEPGELSSATATTLLYMEDGSFFQNKKEDVNLSGTTFSYLLKENEGNHAGISKIQLVVCFNEGLENEQNFPTQLYEFKITSGLENKVAVEVMIQDWTTLTREARTFIDTSADEVDALKDELQTAINTANASLGEFDVALETGIVAANLAEKLEDFEEINNSRLLSTERQLADKASLAQLSQVASPLVADLVAQMTDTARIYVYTGAEGGYVAGNWYYHNGTTWVSGGVYQSTGIADGSIDYNKLSNDLKPILGGYTPLAFDNLLTGIAYYDYTDGVDPAWDGVQYPGYNTYVKNVVPGEKYQITNYVVAEIFAVAQFRTAEDVGGPWVGLGMIGQQSDYQVTVPDGMVKMIVTYATEQSLPSVKKFQVADVSLTQVGVDVKSSHKNALRYNHANKSVRMRFRYNSNHDMIFDIGKRGSNNLPQIAAFYKEPNTTGYLPMDFKLTTQFIADQTDWVSPYVVKAKANIDGDLPLSEHFTGGYHGYNNGASDAVGTATNTSFKVFADKKLLATDCDIYANEIVVEVVNLINATNTKKADGTGRNVLQETVTYTIVGNKIDVSVAIKALEDITIQTYYGIQAYVVAFSNFQFVGDNIMTGVFDTTTGHYGGHKADSDCNVMLAMTATDKLTMFVDNMFGIGKLRYLEATTGVCTYMNYGKMYFYLINNHDFAANTVLNYRGGYVFESLT